MTKNIIHPPDYIIAIPSYNRAQILSKKTFATLKRHDIPDTNIYIFVANNEERDNYILKIDIDPENIIVGVKGLKNQRNYIMDYFPVDTHIVQMDDDIDEIVELVPGVLKRPTPSGKRSVMRRHRTRPIVDLDQFIKRAFQTANDNNIFLWGVYPVDNPYFMTPTETTDLRFIVGPFWGMINRHDKRLKLTVDEKENVERTLQYYSMDDAVLRFNSVSITTNYYKTPGGMQYDATLDERRNAAMKSAEILHKMYPKLTKIVIKKKSKWPEIVLVKPKKLTLNRNGSLTKKISRRT